MKIKAIITLMLLLTIAFHIHAQRSGEINYILSIKTDSIYPLNKINYKILFCNNKSIEEVVPLDRIDTGEVVLGENHILIKKTLPIGKKYFLYKNFSTGKLFLSQSIILKSYLVEDTIPNFNWKISNERTKKSNYNCIKATTSFRGRFYTAWFTEDIPIHNGPWKFCGLPGLIVEINDSENKFVFKLSGINLKVDFDPESICIPNEYDKDVAIKPHGFTDLYNKKVEQFRLMSKVVNTDAFGGTSTTTITLPELMEKF